MTVAPTILQFGSAQAVVPSELVGDLLFELLLINTTAAKSVTRDELCARIRRRTSSLSKAIHVSRDDAVLILRAVRSIERGRSAPARLVELRYYASRLLDLG